MDEFDVNTTSDDHSGEEQALNGSSRRNFLKAAVVGSAAAVAAGGVGAATLTLTGHHTGIKRLVGLTDLVSGVTSGACTTNTQDPLADQTTFNKQESIYFWFKVNNVPAGTYTFDVSPTIDPANKKTYTSGGSLVQYQSGSSDVHVYQYTPSDANFTCNPPTLSGLPTALKTQDTLTITVTTSATKDLLLQVHLQGEKGNPGGSVTLTGTLYQGTGTGGSVEASASANFTIS